MSKEGGQAPRFFAQFLSDDDLSLLFDSMCLNCPSRRGRKGRAVSWLKGGKDFFWACMKAFDIEMGKASKEFDGLKRLSALNKGAEEVAKFITALGSESNPRFFKDVEGGKRVAKFFLHHLLKEKFGGKNVETEAIDSTVEAASKGKKKPLRQLVHKALKSSHPGKFVRLLKRIGFMQ